MPLPLLSGGVHARIHGLWDGQQTVNNLYFQLPTGDPSLPQVQALAALLDNWYASAILPNLADTFSYVSVDVQAINVGFGFTGFSALFAGSGSVSSEAVPNNVDPAISFRTGTAGRSFRGRNYIPGTPNNAVAGNTLDATFMSSMVGGYSQLLSGGGADPTPFVWVVASFFLNGAPRGSAIATPVVAPVFSDNVVDSQRRRLPGRGR